MLIEEFLLGEDELEHGTEFFNHSKNSCKEGHMEMTGRFFFAFGSGSSIQMSKRLLFTGKRNRSVFIHDLERVNEFLRLNSHVKFSSNKVEVADP